MAKLWGGRFNKTSDKLADQFSYSISYDYRLALYDVQASLAHANMLGKSKIIPSRDAAKIISGLKKIEASIKKGSFKFDHKAEDIHTNIQSALKKLIGAPADKLHTARSRNDLIVTDMRLYTSAQLTAIAALVKDLQKAIVQCADKHQGVIMPAYTHLQAAQLVTFAHFLLAYVEMLNRDKCRISLTASEATSSLPLGSGALAGTSLPINRKLVAQTLGFKAAHTNSVDAVSDRDFIIEALSDLAILGTHLSRMAEDFIIYATHEFAFIDIDASLCTGSSIMPHKKNPDILELIRGEGAALISNLNQLLVLIKGLPLTYNRDLQLDKIPLFESCEKAVIMLKLMTKMFKTLKINKPTLDRRIADEAFFSVDIMDYLIKKGVSYRQAHDIVGAIIKECYDQGVSIADLSEQELKTYSPHLKKDVKKLLNAKTSVTMKQSFGSTNPKLVAKEISRWKKLLK